MLISSQIKFKPLSIEGLTPDECLKVEERLLTSLEQWEGTPHMDGQFAKGKAVDCVHFVSGILDELYHIDHVTRLEILPRDLAYHNREGAVAGMKLFIKMFGGTKVSTDDLQSGDVLAVGPRSGGPGHAMIVGPNNTLWHCGASEVGRTGSGFFSQGTYSLFGAFRPANRKEWL